MSPNEREAKHREGLAAYCSAMAKRPPPGYRAEVYAADAEMWRQAAKRARKGDLSPVILQRIALAGNPDN